MNEQQADFDSPWKEVLETYFQEFMAFFFPTVYDLIDWEKGYEFLDKELQKVVHEAVVGRRWADKLVRVHHQNGKEEWILIHIEIQSQVEVDFAERMYVYHYRLFDRYHRRVVSLAILETHAPNGGHRSMATLWVGAASVFDFLPSSW